MSPEQLRVDGVIDARTDIYGLGVVFYEMLTGTLPFSNPMLSELRELILAGNPQPPRSLNPTIPEAYEQICLKCLLIEKDARFQTAKSLAEALRQELAQDASFK
jgi:serine/threonine-protein kinase